MILETIFELSILFHFFKIYKKEKKNEAHKWPGNKAKRLRFQTF